MNSRQHLFTILPWKLRNFLWTQHSIWKGSPVQHVVKNYGCFQRVRKAKQQTAINIAIDWIKWCKQSNQIILINVNTIISFRRRQLATSSFTVFIHLHQVDWSWERLNFTIKRRSKILYNSKVIYWRLSFHNFILWRNENEEK